MGFKDELTKKAEKLKLQKATSLADDAAKLKIEKQNWLKALRAKVPEFIENLKTELLAIVEKREHIIFLNSDRSEYYEVTDEIIMALRAEGFIVQSNSTYHEDAYDTDLGKISSHYVSTLRLKW